MAPVTSERDLRLDLFRGLALWLMINLGGLDYEIWDDGWTVATKDTKWTAQFEHTLVVTEDGADILTLP